MENQRPAPFEEAKPYAQFLIFIGMVCISVFLLLICLMLLYEGGFINLYKIQDAANYVYEDVVQDARNIQMLADLFLFIIPVIVLSYLVSKRKLEYLQINTIGNFKLLLLGIITILVSVPFINFLTGLNQLIPLPASLMEMEQKNDAVEAALQAHHTLYDLFQNILVMALLAAISEEFFFRAGLQKIIIKMTKNNNSGVWITAIIFSAIHMQFSGFFPRMLLGVFLGYLFIWSGSIWVNIAAHFIFNGSQILVQYLRDTNNSNSFLDSFFTDTPGYGYIIISTILMVLLLVAIYKLRKNAVPNDVNLISS